MRYLEKVSRAGDASRSGCGCFLMGLVCSLCSGVRCVVKAGAALCCKRLLLLWLLLLLLRLLQRCHWLTGSPEQANQSRADCS